MYLVEGTPNVAYIRNQLQVVAESEEPPRPQAQKKFPPRAWINGRNAA